MKKKWVSLIVGIAAICVLAGALFVESSIAGPLEAKPIDFTVSGSNSCLRFLNDSVSMVYVPFNVAPNQNWQLAINCTKMPGGNNGYTDLYVYNGYWDNGTNHTCTAREVYPILAQMQSINYELHGTTCYNQTYFSSTTKSYTIFFVFPPGGQATFHVTYMQV